MGEWVWGVGAFALVDLAWLVSVIIRKRAFVPVEAVCVYSYPAAGWGTCSSWLFEFEGGRHVVPEKPDGCCDKRDRKVGDRGIVYVNPNNVRRSLTPQIDGYFKFFGVYFLIAAIGCAFGLLWPVLA